MKNEIKTFKPTASLPQNGLALMFDLEGFSKFFAQPDVQDYVPKYLNHIFDALKIIIEGGNTYWTDEKKYAALPKPIHWKFLGDGLLVIWNYNDFEKDDLTVLLNRCWNLKNFFNSLNDLASEDVPVVDIPQRIRFGFASGTIYKLMYNNTKEEEYIGYCINLASRLQGYCRELGFIASARINPPKQKLVDSSYLKVIAKKIKGFPREIVIVDKLEFESLSKEIKDELFEEII